MIAFKNLAKNARTLFSRNAYSFSAIRQNHNQNQQSKETVQQAVDRSFGLSKFLQRTYIYTGGAVVSSLLSANAVNVYFPGNTNLILGGSLIGFISIIATNFMRPTYVDKMIEGNKCLVAEDSLLRKVLFWGGAIGLGMSLSPLIRMANFVDPNILTRALLATTTTFGVVTIMSMRVPKTSMLRFGSVLTGGLISLILLQLGGIGVGYFYGPNQFSMMVNQVDMYGGVALFTGLLAYDTHRAVQCYEQGQPDHIGNAIQLYLDFINIFTRLVRIMSQKND